MTLGSLKGASPAILDCFYGGEKASQALADVLFGEYLISHARTHYVGKYQSCMVSNVDCDRRLQPLWQIPDDGVPSQVRDNRPADADVGDGEARLVNAIVLSLKL